MGDIMRHADHGPGVICRPALGHPGLCEPLPEPDPAGPGHQEDGHG